MSSRILKDGRTDVQKSQDIKKAKDLEIPQGNKTHSLVNSFVIFNNAKLMYKARCSRIVLGQNEDGVNVNITS